MISRRNVLTCIRTKIHHQCRLISMSAPKSSDDRKQLPSRKLFQDLTEKAYIDEQLTQSGRKPFEAMVEKPIIVKNFFISEIKSEEIIFPQMISMNKFNEWIATNSQIANSLTNINSTNTLDTLKKLNVFGYMIPKMFGGLGCTHTECALAAETETQNVTTSMILNTHRLVSMILCEHGNDEQCKNYLPKLATGQLIGTIAFQEWNEFDAIDCKTRAEYDDDEEQWCLNGIFDRILFIRNQFK